MLYDVMVLKPGGGVRDRDKNGLLVKRAAESTEERDCNRMDLAGQR